MTTEGDLARTKVVASFSISPLENVVGDVAGLLADSQLQLLGMFYPPRVCRKANVVITELVTNVLENVSDPKSELRLDVNINHENLEIRVTNSATPAQAEAVSARIAVIGEPESATRLLTKTLRERRVHRLKGGLGLMRLVAENKFRVSSTYDAGRLTVRADIPLKDFV